MQKKGLTVNSDGAELMSAVIIPYRKKCIQIFAND